MEKEKKQKVKKTYIWEDRTRILGMPISTTKYSLDDLRIYIKKGLLSTTTDELLLYRILDISSKRSLGQKMFGVGDIILRCADKTHPTMVLHNIKHCEEIRNKISVMVETLRESKNIHGNEMYGIAGQNNY